jgi:hypothetical protein
MIVTLSGAHGSGKSTLVEDLRVLRPDLVVLGSVTRHTVRCLDEHDPYRIVTANGVAMLEAMLLGRWIERLQGLEERLYVADRSPIDHLAYYHVHRDPSELRHEPFLRAATRAALSHVDLVVHVPRLRFDVALDDVQPAQTMRLVEETLRGLYHDLQLEPARIHASERSDRARELDELIRMLEAGRG